MPIAFIFTNEYEQNFKINIKLTQFNIMDSVYWFAEIKSKLLPTMQIIYWLLVQGFFEPQGFLKRKKQGIACNSEEGNKHWIDSYSSSVF